MMRRNRKVIYDFSAVDKQMLKTHIEQIIVTELNPFDRQILIEVYTLCPGTITEDAPERTEYPACPIRVLLDLYPYHRLCWYAEKRHPKLINFIRDRLFEKGIISKMP